MSSVLITGGAGFLGSHLARRLAEAKAEVHLIVRPETDRSKIAPLESRVAIHEVGAADQAGLERSFAQAAPATVYHLASHTRQIAKSRIDDAINRIDSDLGFLLAVAKAAASSPRPPKSFIRAASLAEYGASPAPYHEEDRVQPLTSYGASMAACTQVLAALAPSLPFRVAQGRLALVYGPGQSTAFLVAQMIENLIAGRPVEIHNPDARRDLIFIDDAIDGLMRLAEVDCGPDSTLNICTGVGLTMREAANAVVLATGAPASLVRIGLQRTDGADNLWASPDLAARVLGWKARTTFEKGLRQTIERSAYEITAREISR